MSERPTPETDALILSKGGFGMTNYEWREHSRKLERERNKAREDATNYYSKIGELEQERDEAREKAERYRLEANAMMLQRDEAQNKLRLEKLTIISQKEEIELLRQQLIEARNK